ncbi:MAG: heavy metal translocating P-type ATPase [Candidatus Electrothrix sp. LOE1_4_5]|nr:heavy metal translocating P-type ATPase [Candidatus Electrothrix gigas]
MFLFGVQFVFAGYIGVRIYEKLSKDKAVQSNNEKCSLQGKSTEFKQVVEVGEREKRLHYMATSGISVGLSWLTFFNPTYLPAALLVFTYSSFPYLRVVENSLFKKKKIDGYVLYGIADFMTLGMGRLATASFAVGLLHTARFIITSAEKDTKQSLINIFSQQSNKVWLLKEGVEIETSLEAVSQGDVVVVNTGDIIPVDGMIIKGLATIDQRTLTGEAQPAEKTTGDKVFASTQVMSGSLHVQVSNSGNDTTAAKITSVLNNSIDFKTNSQLKGEQWADSWNLPVLGLAFASMPLLGPVGTVVILNGHIAQTIRVVAPLSTLNYINIASHKGILIKDGRVLEDLPCIDTFLFDKTGTLTGEEPEVGRIFVYEERYSENEILAYAAAAECRLTHPVARAILNHAKASGIILPETNDATYTIGYGVSVSIDSKLIQVGSRRFMEKENIFLPKKFDEEMQDAHNSGCSLIMIAIDNQLVGALELHAVIRPEVHELLDGLRKLGVKHFAIVSGDHRQPTQKLAKTLGMDDYFYDVLPQHKADIVEKIQAEGRSVCFVGDGVNDTIAMKKANVSISLSGAHSVATDTAQIVLMDGSLNHLLELMNISFELDKNLHKSWLFNVVPGIMTVIGAFTFRIDIITGLLLSQSGLGLGIINAMLPLRQVGKKEKLPSVKLE